MIAAIVPEGAESYSTAHRTGIIGQVFRTEESIAAADVHDHPLYDTFDDCVDWELCFPLFRDGVLESVINLEGKGELRSDHELWASVCQVVEQTSGFRPAVTIPENVCHFVKTRQFVIKAVADENVIDLAQAIAGGHKTTLLVGDYSNLLRDRGPSLLEAVQRSLGISHCFFGVAKRLDLLSTGPNPSEVLRANPNWWDLCDGRYDFVLVQES